MKRTITTSVASCLLAAGLVATASPVSAAAKPTLKLSSKTLGIVKPAKLVGSHLSPKKVYFLLLAQPSLKNKKMTGLVGSAMTDAKGNLKTTIKAPATAKCGPAVLYAYKAKSKTLYPLKITVSGCKAPKQSVPPPPPPTQP